MGAMYIIRTDETIQVITENMMIGLRILKLLTPIVRRATISESVLILLIPARTPMRVAIGIVNASRSGRRKTSIFNIVNVVAPFEIKVCERMNIMLINRVKVYIASPTPKGAAISLRIYLSKVFNMDQ